MDFGKVPVEQIDKIDFSLPAESLFTKSTLNFSEKADNPRIYLGCTMWALKEWVGLIYPKGTKDADFLTHYTTHFNTIELNATHYKIYEPEMIEKWAAKAGNQDFLFCPKFPQSISHDSNLISPEATMSTDLFLKNVMYFKKHLGPVFIQISDKFSPAARANLFTFLKRLPNDIQFFLELRQSEWFSNTAIRNEWLSMFKSLNIGTVITDAAGRRDVVHMELTVPKTFIRFVGNNLHPTDYTRIDAWVQQIKHWLNNGLQELYFFMHQSDERNSLELSKYVIEQLKLHCGAKLKPLQYITNPQGSLF